jgi:hypothetical protein
MVVWTSSLAMSAGSRIWKSLIYDSDESICGAPRPSAQVGGQARTTSTNPPQRTEHYRGASEGIGSSFHVLSSIRPCCRGRTTADPGSKCRTSHNSDRLPFWAIVGQLMQQRWNAEVFPWRAISVFRRYRPALSHLVHATARTAVRSATSPMVIDPDISVASSRAT